STAVHPESYPVVIEMAKSRHLSVEELIRKPEVLANIKREGLGAGVYTLNDIIEELKKPGRDPREKFVAPEFNDAIREISDIRPGMSLEGVVTNVTKFGAFVDIGVHQDGLVHISELSSRYVKDPSEAVKAGQIVKVKVLNADAKTENIALSTKALQGGPPQRDQKPTPTQPATHDGKLALLSSKWKGR